MATNIEMNLLKDNGSYEILYPKTIGSLISGKVSSATSADSASTLSSTLTVSKGGTGVTSYSSLASQLQGYLSSGLSQSEVETLIEEKAFKKRLFTTLTLSTSFVSFPWTLGLSSQAFLILEGGGSVIATNSTNTSVSRELYTGKPLVFVQNDRANGVYGLLNPIHVINAEIKFLTDFSLSASSQFKTSSGTASLKIYLIDT